MLSILVKPHSAKLPNLIDACYGHAEYTLSKYWLLSLYLVHTKYILSIYFSDLVPKGPFTKRSFGQKVLLEKVLVTKGPLEKVLCDKVLLLKVPLPQPQMAQLGKPAPKLDSKLYILWIIWSKI